MATVYEIIQGLSQAAANAYDGALTEDGEALKAGLKREEGDPILDKRVMDGFNVRFSGNKMILSYMSEVLLKDVHQNGFEDDVTRQLSEVVSFLKKEYRKITGDSVTLTQDSEVDIRVENSSRVRTWLTACQYYSVGGLDEAMGVKAPSEDTLDSGWKSFIELGGWNGDGGKRPDNDSRKKDSGKQK